MRPGARAIATDICVPISGLVETVEQTLVDISEMPMPITLHGHVGDGNFHTVILLDDSSPEEVDAFERYTPKLVDRAIAAGGTCSGEHGIGIVKQRYLNEEHGEALVWMQRVEALFDPFGIMNPGKNIDVRA